MTNQKKLKVIEEAFNYYHDRNSLTSKDEKELLNLVNELYEAISVTRCCTELNNCFKVGENVIYLGVKMKITFVDNCQKTANMYCMCDETNWEGISLSKLTKII